MNPLRLYLLEQSSEPTDKQKEAGNYRKKHVTWNGFDISIENEAGSYREGTDKGGKHWKTKIYYDYGYIKGTKGADSPDQVDVFIGPDKDSNVVYVVNQIDQSSGNFDEHKTMACFSSLKDAKEAYLKNYESGWKCGPITVMSVDDFKNWLKDNHNKVTKPAELKEHILNKLKVFKK